MRIGGGSYPPFPPPGGRPGCRPAKILLSPGRMPYFDAPKRQNFDAPKRQFCPAGCRVPGCTRMPIGCPFWVPGRVPDRVPFCRHADRLFALPGALFGCPGASMPDAFCPASWCPFWASWCPFLGASWCPIGIDARPASWCPFWVLCKILR